VPREEMTEKGGKRRNYSPVKKIHEREMSRETCSLTFKGHLREGGDGKAWQPNKADFSDGYMQLSPLRKQQTRRKKKKKSHAKNKLESTTRKYAKQAFHELTRWGGKVVGGTQFKKRGDGLAKGRSVKTHFTLNSINKRRRGVSFTGTPQNNALRRELKGFLPP